MLTIDTVVLGAVLGLAAFALKVLVGMRVDLKESMSREAAQNADIKENKHQLELLETKFGAEFERTELITNGLLERINHNRQRLESRIDQIENYLNKNSDFMIRSKRD